MSAFWLDEKMILPHSCPTRGGHQSLSAAHGAGDGAEPKLITLSSAGFHRLTLFVVGKRRPVPLLPRAGVI